MATIKIKINTKHANKWSADERRSFADGQRLRAQTIPNKKRLANKKACRGRIDF